MVIEGRRKEDFAHEYKYADGKTVTEYMREYRAKKILDGVPKSSVYNYAWRAKNPRAYILQNAKARARKKGLEFNLVVEDIIIPEVCPVFGTPLELVWGQGTKDNKPSLDRIDSSLGYIKGNVQVISWRANNLKSNGTLTEFLALVEFLKRAN